MSKNKYPCIFLEGKWGLLCFLSLRSFNTAFKIFFVGDLKLLNVKGILSVLKMGNYLHVIGHF